MMEDMQSRVARVPDLDSAITVAPLAFQRSIVAFSTHKNPSRYALAVLARYKSLVEAGKSILYFPLHVNGNHWIAFVIDFGRKFYGYGTVSSAAGR
jgi:hypothetical protein